MAMPTHEYRSKEYHAWIRAKHRCHNPDYEGYETYGGRGIYVCKRWRDSYDAFLNDMGRAPSKELSIERMDNEGGYCCGRPECPECSTRGLTTCNCRWATKIEQGRNRRTNVLINYRGLSLTMVEWAEFLKISRKCLWKRLKMRDARPDDWPLSRVLSPWPPAMQERRAA